VALCSSLAPGKVRAGKVNELFVYDNFSRVPVEEVQAGDICAFTGIGDIGVSVCVFGGGVVSVVVLNKYEGADTN
jgi:predicted membrane GTPase involved in stress response